MEHRDEFLRQYQAEVLSSLALPAPFAAYTPVSCLKEGERSVFLLRGPDQRLYVLKIQPTGQLSTLAQEDAALRSLRHPQVPKARAYFTENGMEYLLRDHVPGVSLAELVSAQRPVTESACLSLALSLCGVLCALHALQPPLIHRDIKPQNVILSPEGVCHLVDFGTARAFSKDQAQDTVYLGTRATAPPEQFGFGQTDARSDVYSLGMLMRYLLSGSYEPLAPGAASRGLRRLIARCTAFDPRRRFASVRALERALRLLQKRKSLWFVAAAVAAAILLALGLFGLGPPPPVALAQLTSPLLAQAVRQELGLPEGAPIPASRLAEVAELTLCGQQGYDNALFHQDDAWVRHDFHEVTIPRGDVGDLSELAALPNLRALVLDYQNIESLEPLRGLPLETLSLVGNRVCDLSPLKDCQTLLTLDISQNPVEDCGALAGLPRLTKLNLNDTNVLSVEALAATDLQELHITGAPVTDYAPLSALPHLHTLEAGALDAASLSVVAGMAGLRTLRMHECPPFANFAAFSRLRSLQELDIAYCTFESLSGLEDLPALRSLNLTGTGITDLSTLHTLPALACLELRHNHIQDLSPLLAMPHLRQLVLEETQRAQADQQLAGAAFQLEIRPH